MLLLIGGAACCGVRPTDARSSWCGAGVAVGGVYRPGWNRRSSRPRPTAHPHPLRRAGRRHRLMSHELPVCLLLPAAPAGRCLKHSQAAARPNCCKEQSCHFLFPLPPPPPFPPSPFPSLLGRSSKERDGRLCHKAAVSDAAPDLANMAAPRKQRPHLKPRTNTQTAA